MAKKKSSAWWGWILIIFLVLGMVGEGGGGILVGLFWIVIIFYAIGGIKSFKKYKPMVEKLFSQKGYGNPQDFIDEFLTTNTANNPNDIATVSRTQKNSAPLAKKLQRAKDKYKPREASPTPDFDHQQTIDGSKAKVKTKFTTPKLIKKYYTPEAIVGDDLAKERYNPFSVSGK